MFSKNSVPSIFDEYIAHLKEELALERAERLRLQSLLFEIGHVVTPAPRREISSNTKAVRTYFSWNRSKRELERRAAELANESKKVADDKQEYWRNKQKEAEDKGELQPLSLDSGEFDDARENKERKTV